MLKFFLTNTISFIFIVSIQAQNTFPSSGNVGIGVNPAVYQLHVKTGNSDVVVMVENTSDGYAQLCLESNSRKWQFSKRGSSEGDRLSLFHFNGSSWNTQEVMAFRSNGNIGIGTGEPGAKLDVTGDVFCKNLKVFDGNVVIGTRTTLAKVDVVGDINCRKLKVLPTTWPDYVFKPEYELMPLPDLKEFIRINKHLPGVPNENQVAKEGIEIGEINKVLLQKIEELTLYVIALKEENEKIEKEGNEKIAEHEARLKKLEGLIEKFSKKD